jgi:outer membrane protein TolC
VGAAVAQTDTTIRSIRLAAEEASYAVLRTSELAAVAQREVDSNREHLRLAEAMLAAGTVAQFEVVQAQTQVSAAEGNLVAAQVAVDQARAQLRKLLVLPQTQPLEVTAPLAPVLQPAGGLADLITSGWNGRPEIRTLQAQIQTADANLRLAQQTDNLSASLNGEYQHNGSATGFTTQQNFWEAAITLTKPILDGGLRKSLVDEANSRLRQARLALEVQRQQIALNVTQAYLAASQALQQLQVATQGVVQAREAARIAEVRFQAGVGTGIEVLDAQIAQAGAEAAQVNASHDLQLALIQLRDAMGQPLEGALKP